MAPEPDAWMKITKPGQLKVGDKLRFTIGDVLHNRMVKRILNAGTDHEEIIYNIGRNYYLITSMAIDGSGSQKNVQYLSKSASSSAQHTTFQDRVQPWMMACFGAEISADAKERNHRFFEESTELVQACGMTASEAHQLVDYVYGRPVGEKNQEVGGVMVTLAALCLAQGLNMHAAGETELARIWTKVEKIRAKQAAKPKHSPLPEVPQNHLDDVAVDRFASAMKAKMKLSRDKGRGGWDDPAQCKITYLSSLLHEHVAKGDPVDVANFCMMLHQRGSGIVQPLDKQAVPSVPDTIQAIKTAYGFLWHVNNGADAPIELNVPSLTADAAAYKARLILRDLLTREQRGEGINSVRNSITAAPASAQDDRKCDACDKSVPAGRWLPVCDEHLAEFKAWQEKQKKGCV